MCENLTDFPEDDATSYHRSDIEEFRIFILGHEEWLIERILFYAIRQGYSKYTSILKEAWRLSISGLSTALISSIAADTRDLELYPDEDYSIDQAASFGVLEAKRHRERGVNFSMFLGLMKYYRQSYLELIDQAAPSIKSQNTCRLKAERFFDRIELGFCTEWFAHNEEDRLYKEKLEGALEMAGAVCHEINQPLQIVLGQTEILKIVSEKEKPLQKNLEMIINQIAKMAKITRRLMNITKYETKPYLSKTIIDIEKSSRKSEDQ